MISGPCLISQGIWERQMVKEKKYTIVTILLIVMVSISSLVTIGSMIYFRMYMKKDARLYNEEYRKYARYYALVARDSADSFWSAAYQSMKDEGEQTNVYVNKMGDNLADTYTRNSLMEMAIDSRVDGIIYEADDSVESIVLINKAAAAGIPVVTVMADAPGSARRSYIGVSNYNLGTEYGRLIMKAAMALDVKKTGEEDKTTSVLVLTDVDPEDTTQNTVLTAIKETIQKMPDSYPEIRLSTVEIDNSGEFTAEESIRDVFARPRLPDIIVCLNEVNTVSVYQTIVEQNRVGESVILGYYDSDTILRAIDKDVIYATITIDTAQLGHDCIEALNEYIDYRRVSDYYGVDYRIINKDNVGDYLESGGENEE